MTKFRVLTRRAINSWCNWKARKALYRIDPRMVELDIALRKCRKSHKRGSAAIIKAKREIIHADLVAGLFPEKAQADRVRESM